MCILEPPELSEMDTDMHVNFWAFLSICVIFGTSFTAFAMYMAHKKSMKQMELDALSGRAPSVEP